MNYHNATNSAWTDERVELLKSLLSAGLSANEIAVELGNTTRNAVIGKISRLGLNQAAQPRNGPTLQKVRAKARVSVHQALAKITPIHPADFVPLNVLLTDLETDHCRHPYDAEDGGYVFCGHAKFEGLPYCPFHCRLNYRERVE